MLFRNVPRILTAKELIDKAFGQAAKINPPINKFDRLESIKIKEIAKIDAVGQIVASHLQEVLEKIPDIDTLPDIDKHLLVTFVDYQDMKQSLGALKWARDTIQTLTRNYRKKFGGVLFKQYAATRKEYYGRVSSMLKQINKNLVFLEDARAATKKMPAFKKLPTVIVSGYPNVGKSSLMKALTGAKPEIQPFPFTTRGILTGILNEQIQIVDTPGLLERPLSERNDIEMTAIHALRYLAGKLLFVIDPTDAAGYPLDAQIRLLKDVEQEFKRTPVVILNKCDLADQEMLEKIKKRLDYKMFTISAQNGEGVPELEKYLLKSVDWKKNAFKDE